jgi:hypothetical protein
MGGTHSFKRDDSVEGMGLQVLVDAKSMFIKSRELDRLYHEFHKLAGEDYYTVDMDAFAAFLQVPILPMMHVFYTFFDKNKTGHMTFYQYMVYNWHFLSASDDTLAAMCFQMFDFKSSGTLHIFEVKYLISAIHSFKAGMIVGWAMDKLDKNEDGFCTIAEFILLCRHFPKILSPLTTIRTTMRKKIVHTRFWRGVESVRRRQFGNLNVFEILQVTEHKELKMASIEYINMREEVPVHMRDKWQHIQERKGPGDVDKRLEEIIPDLPPETLTPSQKGLREFHLNIFIPKRKKKKDVSNFSQFHAKEDEEEDDEAANARLNMLVTALKNEHDRTSKSRKRHSDKKNRSSKQHKSVKPIAGLPSSTALQGAED